MFPEKVIPINMITLPPPEREAPAKPPEAKPPAPAARRPEPRPVRPPKVETKIPPRVTREVTRERELIVPDIVSKLEPIPIADTTLKEKVEDRLKDIEKTPESRPSPAKEVEVKEKPEPAEEVKPLVASPMVRTTRSSLALETADFPHAWYVAIVQNKIYEKWTPPQRLLVIKKGVMTRVRFSIGRNGEISDIKIDEPSGYSLLDRSALEAVRSVVQLPPLPADYKKEYLNVIVFFRPEME